MILRVYIESMMRGESSLIKRIFGAIGIQGHAIIVVMQLNTHTAVKAGQNVVEKIVHLVGNVSIMALAPKSTLVHPKPAQVTNIALTKCAAVTNLQVLAKSLKAVSINVILIKSVHGKSF